MIHGAEYFSDLRKRVRNEIIEPVNEAIAESFMAGYNFSVNHSPVWTGRLRSAWTLSLNRVSRSQPKLPSNAARYQNPRGNDMFGGDLRMRKAQASRSLDNFDIMKHSSIFLSNNVPYALYVEKGGRNIVGRHILSRAKTVIKRRMTLRLNNIV